jgi:hypothetical protein
MSILRSGDTGRVISVWARMASPSTQNPPGKWQELWFPLKNLQNTTSTTQLNQRWTLVWGIRKMIGSSRWGEVIDRWLKPRLKRVIGDNYADGLRILMPPCSDR